MADDLMRAGELLSSYVTYGALREDTQFDEDFRTLEALVPAQARRTPPQAWRVLVVSAADHTRLLDGEAIALRPRAFGSWTKDATAAKLLLRRRNARAEDGTMTLIVRKDLVPGCCVVDVDAFYRALGWDQGLEEYTTYVEWEKEVILRQDDRMLTIERQEVVSAHPPRDPQALRPHAGERVWLPDVETFLNIEAVVDEQPHAADGVWRVVTGDDEGRHIAWDERHDCWEHTDAPGPRLVR